MRGCSTQTSRMTIQTSPSPSSNERLRNLNAEIVAAVSQNDQERLPELLAEQGSLVIALAPELTSPAKAEICAALREAILIATSERKRLQELLNQHRSRAAAIAAYSPEPSGGVHF